MTSTSARESACSSKAAGSTLSTRSPCRENCMAFDDIYRRQVALLIRVLPFVAKEEGFALKGGTAINLFIRDMPRLSVDIDLTYLPVKPRDQSLKAIDAAMKRVAQAIGKSIDGARITDKKHEGAVT